MAIADPDKPCIGLDPDLFQQAECCWNRQTGATIRRQGQRTVVDDEDAGTGRGQHVEITVETERTVDDLHIPIAWRRPNS
jgi:hypothetical protein